MSQSHTQLQQPEPFQSAPERSKDAQHSGFRHNASILLIGVEGSGKRSLSFIGAAHLGYRFVSARIAFAEQTEMTQTAYRRQHGREAFAQRALEVAQQVLQDCDVGCVIECGLGLANPEFQHIVSAFAASHPVIHVVRDLGPHAPPEKDPNDTANRESMFRACSNYEFFNLHDPSGLYTRFTLRNCRLDFERYLDFICARRPTADPGPFSLQRIRLEERARSCVWPIRLSQLGSPPVLEDAGKSLEDAVEVQVDIWDATAREKLVSQVARIRRSSRLPIILSILPSDVTSNSLSDEDRFQILNTGLRMGVEYLVLDASMSRALRDTVLARKGSTRAIAHHHFQNPPSRSWLNPARVDLCKTAQDTDYDGVRLTQVTSDRQDNADVQRFREELRSLKHITIAISAYNVGDSGRQSRVFNNVLTPVDFREWHTPEDTSLTARDISTALFACFELDPLQFWIFGRDVASSRSPPMHQAAYKECGLRHAFHPYGTPAFDKVLPFMRDSKFGGAAISFPFKEVALDACAARSPHADAILSINTIIPLRQLGTNSESMEHQALQRNRAGPIVGLYGDNTDWVAYYVNVQRMLSPKNAATCSRSTALVFGAGGTARSAIYALIQLGYGSIFIHNRTYEKGVRLSDHFNAWCQANDRRTSVKAIMTDLHNWDSEEELPTAIIVCRPMILGAPAPPETWLGNPSGGVVVDASYNPVATRFLRQVQEYRKWAGRQWSIVDGLDILIEQGTLQFEHMTGYRAPRLVMERAMMDFKGGNAVRING